MNITISLLGEQREIEIVRKKMRSVRLHVTDSGEVRISAPHTTAYSYIEKFVREKQQWIEAALLKIEEKTLSQQQEQFKDGESVRILGEQYSIKIIISYKTEFLAEQGEKILIVKTKKRDEKYIKSQFEKWWRAECLRLYTEQCRKFLPFFEKNKVKMPMISVKKMSSQWGSCAVNGAKINLNYYLMRAPMPCVEYVVLHELTHFINPTHNSGFYAFIAQYMPDWKQRRNLLKIERIC